MKRKATTIIECVVAASILMVVMSGVASMAFRMNQVWKDIERERVAMSELSNQLERLTLLSVDGAGEAVESLQVSSPATQVLHQAKMTGELIEDGLGTRVRLSLSWNGNHPTREISIVGWLLQQGENP